MAQARRIKVTLDPFLANRAYDAMEFTREKTPLARYIIRLFEERLAQIELEIVGEEPGADE